MKNQEFIEHLKTLYENCQVYFDIQKKRIIIKKRRTREDQAQEANLAKQFKEIRIRLQELKIAGETDLPETPPAEVEDAYEDGIYQIREAHFDWLITKLEEWENNQNKRVESVASLIEFTEWTNAEEERLEKQEKEVQRKIIEESFLALVNQQIEQKEQELERFNKKTEDNWKKIHPNFNLELKEKWEKNDFNYLQIKDWIGVGLNPRDSGYATWLRDILELNPFTYLESLFSYSENGDEKVLREQYQEYFRLYEESEEDLLARAIALSLGNDEQELKSDSNGSKSRNILLIGRTGSGKSTLGNVLINENGNFEEVFQESAGSISRTKQVQVKEFTVDISRDGAEKINYLVIDTIGFGDTHLNNEKVLQLLKELIPIIKENGINQIFFVTDGRFTEKEIETYQLLTSVLFDEEVVKHTTIVRTRFPEFEDLNECEEDRQILRAENEEMINILKNSKIIYVNNPPMVGRSAGSAKELREESRKRLLTYLGICQGNYKPSNLESLSNRIDEFVTKEESLNREIKEKEEQIKAQEAQLEEDIQKIRKQKERDLEITGRNFERQVKDLKVQNDKKVQTTQRELEEVRQKQLSQSQEAYNQTLGQINSSYQSNLSQIRESLNSVRAGEPICKRGHDTNIKVYDKLGSLIPDHQSSFIGHIYCPICGENQTDYTLRNVTTYTLEELSRRESQQASERNRIMQETIQNQEQQKQETISRIMRLRNDQESTFQRALDQQKRTQELLFSQQWTESESSLSQQRQDLESRVNTGANEREANLRSQNQQQVEEQRAQIQQAEKSIDLLWKGFF